MYRNEAIDPDKYIIPLFDKIKAIGKVDAHQLLTEMYETHFGFHNHLDVGSRRPLGSVAQHDVEDNYITTKLYKTIESFVTTDVYSKTGLSVIDFLSLPDDVCQMVLDAVRKKEAKSSDVADQLQREVANLGRMK